MDIVGMDRDVVDIDEMGLTIKENARLKAVHYYNQVDELFFLVTKYFILTIIVK